MRGRTVEVGDSSCILYVRHRVSCPLYGNSSGDSECECVKSVQFKDGSRKTTSQWTWRKAEEKARHLLPEHMGLVEIPTVTKEGHTVQRAVEEWIEEREKGGVHNVKARYLTKKLLAWANRNNIRLLGQIEKQALRVWGTSEWKYQHGHSASMKIHWLE